MVHSSLPIRLLPTPPTCRVLPGARTICEAERLSRRLTMGANKPVAPASLLQVGGAGRVVGKKSLELWERLWEPKIATLVNVHEHGRTLPLVAVGDNRIGKHSSTR